MWIFDFSILDVLNSNIYNDHLIKEIIKFFYTFTLKGINEFLLLTISKVHMYIYMSIHTGKVRTD